MDVTLANPQNCGRPSPIYITARKVLTAETSVETCHFDDVPDIVKFRFVYKIKREKYWLCVYNYDAFI